MNKICDTCTLEQPENQFLRPGRPVKYGTSILNPTCITCRKKGYKTDYSRPAGYASAYKQRHFDRLAGEDPSCHCCGETLKTVLSIGKEDKQVWCLNCKWATGLHGACHPVAGDSAPDDGFCQGD